MLVNLKETTIVSGNTITYYKENDHDDYDSYYMRRNTIENNMNTMIRIGNLMKREIDFDSMYLGLNTKALNGKLKSFLSL